MRLQENKKKYLVKVCKFVQYFFQHHLQLFSQVTQQVLYILHVRSTFNIFFQQGQIAILLNCITVHKKAYLVLNRVVIIKINIYNDIEEYEMQNTLYNHQPTLCIVPSHRQHNVPHEHTRGPRPIPSPLVSIMYIG